MKKHIYKIEEVMSQDNLVLLVRFEPGVEKLYDLKPLILEIKAFEILEGNPRLSSSVHVASGGYGVIWNEDLDLSCDELWHNGKLPA